MPLTKNVRNSTASARAPARALVGDCMGHFSAALRTVGAELSDAGIVEPIFAQWCLPFARQHSGVWTAMEAAAKGAIADKAITAIIAMDKRRRIFIN